MISASLIRYARGALVTTADAGFAANQFLQMIVSLPQLRAIGLGAPIGPEELDAWVRSTVALSLEGYTGMVTRVK